MIKRIPASATPPSTRRDETPPPATDPTLIRIPG